MQEVQAYSLSMCSARGGCQTFDCQICGYAVSQQTIQFVLDCQNGWYVIPATLMSGKYKPREIWPSLGEIQCNHSVASRQMQACYDNKFMQEERFLPRGLFSWRTAIALVAGHGCNPRTTLENTLEQRATANIWALSSVWTWYEDAAEGGECLQGEMRIKIKRSLFSQACLYSLHLCNACVASEA